MGVLKFWGEAIRRDWHRYPQFVVLVIIAYLAASSWVGFIVALLCALLFSLSLSLSIMVGVVGTVLTLVGTPYYVYRRYPDAEA